MTTADTSPLSRAILAATGPDGAPWELSETEQERAVAACEGMRER